MTQLGLEMLLGPTLDDARAQLELDRTQPGGTRCPCCDQHAQEYRWSLYASAVRCLIRLYKLGGTTRYVHSREVKLPGTGDMSRLRHWGLVEEEPQRRPDGGKSGYWRVTAAGEAYLQGAPIPRYIYVYDGTLLRTDGGTRTIHDALGVTFDYSAMLEGTLA